MAEYSIGEVERLTGLKAHVLRYWEETVTFLRPRKDDRGRRVYSSRDVELILRLKELIHGHKFTLEGAGERLMRELTGEASFPAEPDAPPAGDPPGADGDGKLAAARKAIGELRQDLLAIYALARKNRAD